jgi:DNA-binding winged helix-turn-helix (wHTH) protein
VSPRLMRLLIKTVRGSGYVFAATARRHHSRRQSASQNSQSKPVCNRGQKTWRFVLVELRPKVGDGMKG